MPSPTFQLVLVSIRSVNCVTAKLHLTQLTRGTKSLGIANHPYVWCTQTIISPGVRFAHAKYGMKVSCFLCVSVVAGVPYRLPIGVVASVCRAVVVIFTIGTAKV